MNAGERLSHVLEVNDPSPGRVVARYTRLAPVYELWARLTETRPRERVLELAAPRDGEDVLEVAVGTGSSSSNWPAGTAQEERSGSNFRKVCSSRRSDSPMPDSMAGANCCGPAPSRFLSRTESFDLLVNSYMLDLLPRADIPVALGEFSRLLRPGGRLVLSNMTMGETRGHRIWDALYARGLNLTANCRGVLAAPVLDDLGFSRIRREYMAQFGFPTEIVSAEKS